MARDEGLYFHAGSGANRADAEREAMSKCESVAPPCRIFKTFSSDQTFRTRGQPQNLYVPVAAADLFRRHGVIVSPDSEDRSGERSLWLATGFDSQAEAEQAGRAACEQAAGQPCSTRVSGADTFLGTFVTSQGSVVTTHGPTEDWLRDFVPRHCRENGYGTCRITNLFDIRRQAVFAIRGGG